MQYTTLGKTGIKASRFGLGCMRFTEDEKNAINMTRYALDNGVNYLDTGYFYKNSEEILGKALKDGYREKAILVTKCPMQYVEKESDFERLLDEQLSRLDTDYLDFYLLHNVDVSHWEIAKRYDGMSFLDKMIKKGKILHKGCSIHGSYNHLKTVLGSFDWELVTMQLGILDKENQAGVKGLKEIGKMGIAATIMSPLRGGNLLKFAPQKVYDLIEDFPVKRSLAEWGFRFLYDKKEVSVVLSGVKTMEQLKENIDIFNRSEIGAMTDLENKLIEDIREAFFENYAVSCTNCNYCMPCPAGVNIPKTFNYYNLKEMTNHWSDAMLYKKELVNTNTDASQCVECGQCEPKCPQSIEIIKKLKEAHSTLTK
jgi:predicted aldo/keto reductase-like oxidoreductase